MNAENRSTGSPLPEPHTQVTPGDLRRLLEMNGPEATLVLTAGRIEINTGPEDAAEGLPVITRTALTDRIGAEPEDGALTLQAAELNTEIRLLGS
ncbi:hypothetical protein [Nocardia sp. NBC_00416]|uniref:hypothetical protein n=1 Tax=Nocardia sp. NBC_00416 TaxID=2975991 RepID=UPI002E1D7ED2